MSWILSCCIIIATKSVYLSGSPFNNIATKSESLITLPAALNTLAAFSALDYRVSDKFRVTVLQGSKLIV